MVNVNTSLDFYVHEWFVVLYTCYDYHTYQTENKTYTKSTSHDEIK